MRTGMLLSAVALCLLETAQIPAQQPPAKKTSSSRLKRSTEVATTTGEGYPSSLPVTLTNIGSVPLTMPAL